MYLLWFHNWEVSTVNYEKYSPDLKKYKFNLEGIELEVDFTNLNLEKICFDPDKKKKGGEIECTLLELIQGAEEIDNMLEMLISKGDTSIRYENFKERIEKATIMSVINNNIEIAKKIKIKNVSNVLGMVGAGKSTIMNVLAYVIAKKGYRACVVLETTKEVFDLNNLLNKLGVNSVALKGNSTILKQIDKVIEDEVMYIDEKYSKELTGTCILDGCMKRVEGLITIPFGEEPCHKLRKVKNQDDKKTEHKYLCPAYRICERRKNERNIANASVIITNTYSLVYGKTHYREKEGRKSILEYAIDYMDLVIFDEADKVQVTLDKIFCSNESVKKLLHKNHKEIFEIVDPAIEGKGNKYAPLVNREFAELFEYLSEIRNYITENRIIKDIEFIQSGKLFSALLILEHTSEIKEKIKNELIEFISRDADSLIVNYFISHRNLNILDVDKEKMDPKIKLKLKFIITLILFEKKLLSFSTTLQIAAEQENLKFEIPDIFRIPLRSLRKLIPTSPIGNRLGYIYDKENKDITIFRQYGVGRSILLNLPSMKLNEDGECLGPNVLLLSGSSWAEGSYKYHIHKPISYILKSDNQIIKFIENTKCYGIHSRTRVSGKENKIQAIAELIQESNRYIEKELDLGSNLLFIVNSYDQCKKAQKELKKLYQNINIYRLVSDKDNGGEGLIKRGDLKNLYRENFRILIAPATSIERGHNIVDEIGHSVLNTLFFLVRPMEVPRDVVNIVSTVNGRIIESAIKHNRKKVYNRNLQIIDDAYIFWNKLFESHYAIANADETIKRDIVVSRLVMIIQIFGRLLRISDFNREVPKIYFLDGAFFGNDLNGFDLIEAIKEYLKKNIYRKDIGNIVELLYGPFYKSLKGDGINV
ncbi:MAG: hypothetical protein ACRC41_15790 [Sarcina sp.]